MKWVYKTRIGKIYKTKRGKKAIVHFPSLEKNFIYFSLSFFSPTLGMIFLICIYYPLWYSHFGPICLFVVIIILPNWDHLPNFQIFVLQKPYVSIKKPPWNVFSSGGKSYRAIIGFPLYTSSISSLNLFLGDEFEEIFWGPTGYGSCLTLKKTLALDGNAHYLWEMVDCGGSFNVLCQIGRLVNLRCIYVGRPGIWSSGTQLWSAQIYADYYVSPVNSGFNILI